MIRAAKADTDYSTPPKNSKLSEEGRLPIEFCWTVSALLTLNAIELKQILVASEKLLRESQAVI